ncbi:MAG: DNA topoisomerase, partial [Patescibacteria group bacterium]
SKSKNAQEAHEAVRPTNFGMKSAGATDEQQRLYKLIWERTVASQMTDAKILRTKISANVQPSAISHQPSAKIPDFSANGSVMIFPGWLAADPAARGEDVELPKLAKDEPLKLLDIASEGKQTEPPPRYTEAGLIKELEKRDIGRPSTYASIIKTINDRGYVTKEGKTLTPTDTGEVVSDFLEKNFAQYISDSFTAEMENELDEIAEGKRKYEKMLKDFYGPFSKDVKLKEKTAEKITNLGEAGDEHKCPVCGGPMVIKLSRNGRFLSCAKFPKCSGARKIDGSIMEGPKETGEDCPKCKNGKLIEREGRFGKFISCNNYPKCKFIKKSAEQEAKEKTGVKCPACNPPDGGGEILERRGRFGPFFSCSNYPKCRFIMKSRPTGNICKLCGSLMMEGTKTIPERCSNKTCANYNPVRSRARDAVASPKDRGAATSNGNNPHKK